MFSTLSFSEHASWGMERIQKESEPVPWFAVTMMSYRWPVLI